MIANLRLAIFRPKDGGNIKPGRKTGKPPATDEFAGTAPQKSAFLRANGQFRGTGVIRPAGSNFDKRQVVTVYRHNIQFAPYKALVSRYNLHT